MYIREGFTQKKVVVLLDFVQITAHLLLVDTKSANALVHLVTQLRADLGQQVGDGPLSLANCPASFLSYFSLPICYES